MSPLEVLQLVGYSTAAALHLWIAALLSNRRRAPGKVERVLLPLAVAVGVWHASNFFVALHSMLGLAAGRWSPALKVADTLAVTSVTLTYSLLLHLHLHLWAGARRRPLNRTERARVYISYAPALFLAYALPTIWADGYEPMFARLSNLVLPFALWAAYVLCLVAGTDFLIARLSSSRRERRLMLTLAASFVSVAALILAVFAFGVGAGRAPGGYLQTLANLGSLLPTALLAYHIYRYRYLELAIKETLIVASFAAVVLVVYLYGIRTLALWATEQFGLRAAAVEAILILLLALVASPLRRWLDRHFRELFAEETALYRDLVRRIGGAGGRFQELPELLSFVERRAAETLGLSRVSFRLFEPRVAGEASESDGGVAENGGGAAGGGPTPSVVFPLAREGREVGVMLVEAEPDVLTYDVLGVLEMLAAQVAVAVEDCRLVEENVRLERRIAESERLAALGRMAATVAHEVKNPLSAIKSIAQVMREDARFGGEYGRDLDLIVGETDRLARSVTQMLSFARGPGAEPAPRRADELLQSIARLFSADAAARGVTLVCETVGAAVDLDGRRAAALRDAVSNLVLNALQAVPAGGRVEVRAAIEGDSLAVKVSDTGAGVPADLADKIWEPFFTTKQRGTGLGLPIVRRRLEEAGGAARLVSAGRGPGATFEARVPLDSPAAVS
ncbi:MAG TPA: ATP-binding protein [Pyrinomonadaceae bacterium]|nr:ATP-binding protein [Pyrinomonadaceae bacterium]